MKRFLLLAFAFPAIGLFAQKSFYKGALVTDLNFGFDAYAVHYHTEIKNTSYSHDTTDGAASHNWGIGAQYGVTNWLGLGLRAKFDNYYTSVDKNTGYRSTVKGNEIGAIIDFHVVRGKVFNLALGIDAGRSGLKFWFNDPDNTRIYGSGSWFDLHITPRFYFGRFGISTTLYLPWISYSNMTTSSDVINDFLITKWKANGFGINFGVQYRFLKDRS